MLYLLKLCHDDKRYQRLESELSRVHHVVISCLATSLAITVHLKQNDNTYRSIHTVTCGKF